MVQCYVIRYEMHLPDLNQSETWRRNCSQKFKHLYSTIHFATYKPGNTEKNYVTSFFHLIGNVRVNA